jgi:bis(5'-nucleosidyl)-tetraphosphatase
MSSETIEQSFGVIPFYRKGQRVYFLLVQHNSGHWSFPKGHPEAGETEVDTARRELCEETGICDVALRAEPALEEEYTKPAWEDAQRTATKRVRYFLGEVRNPQVRLQRAEIQDYCWAPYEEAREILTYESSRRLLERAAQALGLIKQAHDDLRAGG